MYGRNATLPLSFNLLPNDVVDGNRAIKSHIDSSSEKFSFIEHMEKMIDICKVALTIIGKAQERQKKYFDAKHCKRMTNLKSYLVRGLGTELDWSLQGYRKC